MELAIYQPADEELRNHIRRFQAVRLAEANATDVCEWAEATSTDDGITLASGFPVPFGWWVLRQEGMYLGMNPDEFATAFVPA